MRPERRLRAYAAPALVFTVAVTVSFASLLVAGVNRADEAWNLHLIDRMVRGDVLYRDIRYFPTPLALFAGRAAAAVFGPNILMLKGLVAVSFGVTATTGLLALRMLSAGRRTQLLFVALLLLFALPPASSSYNTLVITFVSVTALLVLRWDAVLLEPPSQARSRRLFLRATAVGVATGACLLTKYNVGAAAALAVAGSLVIALVQGRIDLRGACASALTATGAAALAVLAGMSPVLLQGAAGDFARQLLDGGSILDGPVSYGEGWRQLLEGVRRLDAADMRTFGSYALLPVAALAGGLAVVRTAGAARGRLLMLGLFSLAAMVLNIPRADHAVWAVPVPIALLAASAAPLLGPFSVRRPALATALRSLGLGFVLTWLVLALVHEGLGARHFERVRSGSFEGALLPPGRWQEIVQEATEIRSRIGTDHKVFILSQEAGMFYLTGGIRNPTRYDYPDVFEFGADGVAAVRAALVNYTINFTCISRTWGPGLEPAPVIGTVQAYARPVARLRACDLWQTGGVGRPRWP